MERDEKKVSRSGANRNGKRGDRGAKDRGKPGNGEAIKIEGFDHHQETSGEG